MSPSRHDISCCISKLFHGTCGDAPGAFAACEHHARICHGQNGQGVARRRRVRDVAAKRAAVLNLCRPDGASRGYQGRDVLAGGGRTDDARVRLRRTDFERVIHAPHPFELR